MVFSAIDGLYQASLDGGLWPRMLEGTAGLTGGAGMLIFPLADAPPPFAYVSPVLEEAIVLYRREWFLRCPRRRKLHVKGLQNSVVNDGDLFTRDEVRRSEFHHDFLLQFDCGDMISRNSTAVQPGMNYVLASQRGAGAPPPDREEIALFSILSAHLIRALQVYRRLSAPEAAHGVLTEVLDRLTCGAVVVDPGGHAVHHNVAAERLAGDGFSLRGGSLRTSAHHEQERVSALLRGVLTPGLGGEPMPPVALSRPSGRKPLLLQAIPLSPRMDAPLGALLDDLGAALILIVDPERESPPSTAEALKLLGLTATEAKVAALLGTGWSPQEIADRHQVLTATVRFHIKQLYSKLDIRRQGELTRIVQALSMVSNARLPIIH